ncbi:putative TPR repeat methyltransferase [Rhodobium orientis]|uniref:S-adenosylmethionine-dependent methyltransferase n=1 Tax=Rhodobium orientis TaxID=34017 RepID=A0A327JJL3_9HYPH|nr:methyltransferase [Rhodobium orientis]MBB4301489.1 putative TPR repeat methyltransferase [Rhodobium orientis]MBK5952186.1 S-adenosylmethionine-dependent methyltransferase [Rhodobium orientis]RAI25453.1 S-adenosylmethionine-dependent methyltransferase [Rhodobium orientis]
MTEPETDTDDALAEAYNAALDLEKAGDLEAAVVAYQKVLELDPADHGGVAVRLAAIGRGETPAKAPDAYVATLFDQHADVFDMILVDQLGYCVPLLVEDRLKELAPGPYPRLLDLGCGTGLSGEALEERTSFRVGVDISEGMIEVAHEREVYDELYVAEAGTFLETAKDGTPFDLIVATDVLPYLGDLEGFFAGVAANLAANGVFGFSSESLPDDVLAGRPYMVGPNQRFAHAGSYIERTLTAAGLARFHTEPITVRHQEGVPVPGDLVLARKPA